MVDKVLENLNTYKIYIKDLSVIRKGETSDTYVGTYLNKKIILKDYSDKNFKIHINSYLDKKILTQLAKKKIFPKIIFHKPKINILIYEYVEEVPYKKNNKLIARLGNQIRTIHKIKIEDDIHKFEDQIEKYKSILGNRLKTDFQKLKKLIKKSREYNSKIRFSHNDLNINNIINSHEIYFIDFEYASLNNIFCDISKVIEEYSFNELEIDILLSGYGIKYSQSTKDQIAIWKDINILLSNIWAEMMSHIVVN